MSGVTVRDQDDRLELRLGRSEQLLERRIVQYRPAHVRLSEPDPIFGPERGNCPSGIRHGL